MFIISLISLLKPPHRNLFSANDNIYNLGFGSLHMGFSLIKVIKTPNLLKRINLVSINLYLRATNSNNREKIPLNKEHLFVYNKEQTFFIKELVQWIMGSYQTESLFA